MPQFGHFPIVQCQIGLKHWFFIQILPSRDNLIMCRLQVTFLLEDLISFLRGTIHFLIGLNKLPYGFKELHDTWIWFLDSFWKFFDKIEKWHNAWKSKMLFLLTKKNVKRAQAFYRSTLVFNEIQCNMRQLFIMMIKQFPLLNCNILLVTLQIFPPKCCHIPGDILIKISPWLQVTNHADPLWILCKREV